MDDFRCSASTLNLFMKDPCLFILKHYYGMRTEFNVHAMRGKAIEFGVDECLKTGDIEKSKQAALDNFYDITFELDHDFEDIENKIPQWTENSITALNNSKPVGDVHMQTELRFVIDGLPFVGYLDYEFDNEVIDLKTVSKVPSLLVRGDRKGRLPAAKADNIRQQSLYRMATGKPCKLLYTSDTDSLLYNMTDAEFKENEKEIRKVIKEIKKLLTEGLEYGITKYRPNEKLFKSFYYNEEMVHKAIEIWKLDDKEDILDD